MKYGLWKKLFVLPVVAMALLMGGCNPKTDEDPSSVTAVNDNAVMTEDSGSVVIDVTKNDTDDQNDTLIVTIEEEPEHGSVTVNDGNITYTPDGNFSGTDCFTYKVTADPGGDSDTAEVCIEVENVNDAPVANTQSISTNEDQSIYITLTASDVDGDTLTYSVEVEPSHGTLSGTAPNLTYSPEANYNGPDSFSFKVNDNTVDSAVATVNITVNPRNDAPVATDNNRTVPEETAIEGNLITDDDGQGVDSDIDGDELTVNRLTLENGGYITIPNNSTIERTFDEGTLRLSYNGHYTFAPSANFNGTVQTFRYRLSDGTNTDVATLILTYTAVNDAPEMAPQEFNIKYGETKILQLVATDVDGDTLTFAKEGNPDTGTINSFNTATGAFEYTAPERASNSSMAPLTAEPSGETTTFDVNVTDGTEAVRGVTITININESAAPVANEDNNTIVEDGTTPVSGDMRSNDTDEDNAVDELSVVSVNGNTNTTTVGTYGTLTWSSDGSYQYDLNNSNTAVDELKDGETLTDTFDYTIEDPSGASDSSTLTIKIEGQNEAGEYNIEELLGQNLSEVEYDDGDDDGEDPEGAEMEPTGDDCEGDDCEDNDGTLIHWNFDSGTLDMRYWMLAKDHSNDEKYKFDILDESLDYTSSVDEINVTEGSNRYKFTAAGARLLDGMQSIKLYGVDHEVTFDDDDGDKQYLVDLTVLEGHPVLENAYTQYEPYDDDNLLHYASLNAFMTDFSSATDSHSLEDGVYFDGDVDDETEGELKKRDGDTTVGTWEKVGEIVVLTFDDDRNECWKDIYGIQDEVLFEGEWAQEGCTEQLELYNESATEKIDGSLGSFDHNYEVPEDKDAIVSNDINNTMVMTRMISEDVNITLEFFGNGMVRIIMYGDEGIREEDPARWEVDANGRLLIIDENGYRDGTILFLDNITGIMPGQILIHFDGEDDDPSALEVMAQTPILQVPLIEADVENKMFMIAGYERSFMFRGGSKGTLNVASSFDAKNRVKNIDWSINPYGEIVLKDDSDHPMGTIAFFNKHVVTGTQGVRKYANTPPFNGLVERIFVESSQDLFGAVVPLVVDEESFMGKLLMFQQLKLNIALYGDKRGDDRNDCEIAHRMLNSPGTNTETCTWSIITDDDEEKLQIVTDDSGITYTFTFTGDTASDEIAQGEMVGLAIQPSVGDQIDMTIVLNSITDMDFNPDDGVSDVSSAISGSVVYMMNTDVAVFETDSTGYHIEIEEDGNATRNDFCWKKEDNDGIGLYNLDDMGTCTEEQFLRIDFYNALAFGKGSVAKTFEDNDFAGMLRVTRYYKIGESTTEISGSDTVSNKIIKPLMSEYNTMIYAEDGTYYEYGRNTGTDEEEPEMGWWSDVSTWTWESNRAVVEFSSTESFNIGFDNMPEEGVEGDFEYTEEGDTETGNFVVDKVIDLQPLIP